MKYGNYKERIYHSIYSVIHYSKYLIKYVQYFMYIGELH